MEKIPHAAEVFMMDTNRLRITMFGDFTLTYGDTPLKLERTNTTKSMQALQLLLYHGDAGVPRDTLLDLLYAEDRAAEPANNLKVTMSNLRRQLLHAGLPEDTTVRYRGGSYFWEHSVPQDVDIRSFEAAVEAAQTARGARQTENWITACGLYKGDFLPHLQGENWAAAACAHYREQYFRCVKKLIAVMTEAKQYEQLLPVVTRAAGLYGLEEFQLARIDCLMNLQRYAEAKQVYEETARGLRDDYDLGPSPALLARCRALDEMANDRTETIREFQENLVEAGETRGAYYCTYPGFIDAYRVVARMLERSGQSAYLVLCWLTDTHGHEIAEKDRLAVAAPKVSSAIRNALRRGDLYTQPARDRFLILLVGTNQENCAIVTDRITNTYKSDPARGVSLRFRLAPVGDALGTAMFSQKPGWTNA
jgi:DNA-binding SARP family transcriptional activator